MSRCPGQDTQTWGFDAIFEVTCPKCGKEVEFFKDEMKHKCPYCGERVFNERMNMGCAKWCPSAASCVGPDSMKDLAVSEQRKKRREDFRFLLETIPETDADVRELFKTLYTEYPGEDALFDTNRLYTVKEDDEPLFNRATAAFKHYHEAKAAIKEREASARARTEEMLKNDQVKKRALEKAQAAQKQAAGNH